jgi:LPP20 lipoprotein
MTYALNLFKLLVVATSLLCATIVFAAQPKWITDSSLEYPASMYLIGRGAGSTAEDAQNRARGDLATIFEVRIEVKNENSTTVTQTGKNEQVDRLAIQQVSAKTDKVISGINIAEVWRDPVTQDFHALAVLPRAQASASLREELSKIDDELNQQMQAAKSADDPLLKIGALSQALQASIKREGFQASLKVIDPSGRGVQAPFSPASVQKQINDTLKQVRIAPMVVEDDGAKEFAPLLKGGLAAAGFLTSSSANADLVLEGKLNLTDLGHRDGWNWMRATVEVTLVEKDSRRVRGSKTWPVKASAKDARTARSRTMIEIEKLFKEELRAMIVEFASS